MSRPVPLFPSLPRSPNAPVLDQMVQFDADLTRSLFLYLSDLARRVNDALTVDGADPMEGDLDLGGFDIINGGDITTERIRLTATDDAGLVSTLHAFQVGPTAGVNIIMDGNETMARNNGAASTYFINVEGGNIQLGNTSSILTLTGGKIAFPATQQASADANTLDDYEEGSWVVTSAGTTSAGAGTYTIQDAHYTKIGRVVYIRINVGWSAHTGTGNLRINNLPFPVGSYGAPSAFPMTTIPISGMTYAGEIQSLALGGTSNLDIFLSASGATIAAVPMDTAMQIEIGGFYFT